MTTLPETESGFQGWVVNLAHTYGWLVFHARPARNAAGGWTTATIGDIGFPDLVLARGGRVVFAELKAEGGRLALAQQAWLDELQGDQEHNRRHPRARSHEVHVWRPADRDEIRQVLA